MKKFISMALALVMTLSLCTFVAAPKADAAFTDAEDLSSQYAEQAADVIQKIEVMDGYDDGSFRPEAGLTRQAAAKIICNMILGPTTAKALPTNANPFPDVLAGNQFSGYVSYCSQQGIISGYADGTFRPGDPLSGYAYLKMLLGALGYDSRHEGFVGDNWKVNVAKIALGIGLNKGIDEELDGTTQVTREAAAIYAFNTLQADMVEYESKNTIEINGVQVSMGGGNAVPQTWSTSATQASNINDARSDGDGNARGNNIVQFAERYFDKLERFPKQWDTYTQDDFGRPSIRWNWKGVEIGTYSRDPDATFVGDVKVNAIYEALRENTGMSSGSSTASLYINSSQANRGYYVDPSTVAVGAPSGYVGQPNGYSTFKVERGNDKDLSKEIAKSNQGTADSKWTDGIDNDGARPATGLPAALAGTAGKRNVDRIGDGTLIEVYRNDATNHVDVCVISVYGGKVDAVKGATTKKDAYVTISVSSDWDKRPDTIMVNSGKREYETEDFQEDDVVAYTYSDSAQSIKSMYLLTPEGGALQSKVTGKSLRLDSTTYSYAKEYTFDDLTEGTLSNKSSYIVYLDENDYVLWVEEDEFSVSDFVLVERITIETTVNDVTTKTASVLGGAQTNAYAGANSVYLQNAYNQSKDAVGNSSWDAQAQVRYSNGTRRTVTLDDSKNYRTSSADDRLKAASIFANVANETFAAGVTAELDANNQATGYALDVNNNRITLTGVSGDDGNWIAEAFTAGHIVRLSSNSDGYRLHSINPDRFTPLTNFSLEKNKMYQNGALVGTIEVDSETHFVIEDKDQGSYKSYVGVKNAPTVKRPTGVHAGDNPTAYVYYTGGAAKLVYVTNAWDVSNSSGDIVFLVANSTSNEVESDDGVYYEISAVEKNEIKTLRVKKPTNGQYSFTGTAYGAFSGTPYGAAVPGGTSYTFTPGVSASEKEAFCVILTDVNYDSNDFINRNATFTPTDETALRYQGIRRVNDTEIRVNTAVSGILKDVADDVRVYFVDGDDIEEIDYFDIVTDSMDYVYAVEDSDDGEITYLFIVNYDGEDTTTPAPSTGYNILTSANTTTNGYTLNFNGKTTAIANEVVQFQVNFGGVPQNSTDVAGRAHTVTVEYPSNTGFTQEISATANGQIWSVTIPSDVNGNLTFKVE